MRAEHYYTNLNPLLISEIFKFNVRLPIFAYMVTRRYVKVNSLHNRKIDFKDILVLNIHIILHSRFTRDLWIWHATCIVVNCKAVCRGFVGNSL